MIYTTTGRKVSTISQPDIKMMNFSPRGRYLQTYQYMKKVDNQVNPNLILWDTTTGEKVHSWILKSITTSNWFNIFHIQKIICKELIFTSILFFFSGKNQGLRLNGQMMKY